MIENDLVITTVRVDGPVGDVNVINVSWHISTVYKKKK